MSGILAALAGIKTAIATAVDEYFNRVTLLLPGNGTNGAQNNTFLDSSSNNFTITRNGNTTQGTFSPFSQTGWSNYFGVANTDNIVAASASAFAIGTGNFTVECFYNPSAWSGTNQRFFLQGVSGTSNISLGRDSGADTLIVQIQGTTVISYSWTPSIGRWYHLALVRSGTGTNQVALYIDGVSVATGTSSASIGQNQMIVGGLTWSTGYNAQGYIASARYSNTARYSGTFTPTTASFTSDANTLLLTCQSNRFVDNSSNSFAITVNGTPSVQAFSPFAPTSAYSAATNGGSGYFDGTGDYLTMSSNAALAPGTGDFTIEAWLYPTAALSTYNSVYETAATNGLLFGKITSGYGVRSAGTADLIASTAPAINQWVHVAASRSGTDLRLFINGELKSTVTNSTNFATGSISLGASGSGTNPFPGYISGLRFVKGTALYTTTFTVPTSPPTAVSNTNFLGNFTNAGITDATGKNDLETVGNAQISTTQSKFGGSSMYFDGTGDALNFRSNDILAFGTGDFTIEFWVYHASITGQQTYVGDTPGNSNGPYVYKDTSNKIGLYYSTQILTATNAISATTWYHVAIARASGTVRLFINGTQEASASDTTNLSVPVQWIGADGTSNYLNGYIDDLRITKGYARYTGNFSVPTAAFPVQ